MTDSIQKRKFILLLFISPILGLVAMLKTKNEKLILFSGVLFFALAGSLYVYDPGSDGHTHLMRTKSDYMDMSWSTFWSQFYEILTFNTTTSTKDIYLHCISYVSGSVFQIPELIHTFAGLVLGYFFTKSILLVLKDKLAVQKSIILIAFIVLLIFDRGLGALNSIRMWTGMWVFFYGAYSYALTKEKKYFFLLLFAIFVHFSYLIVFIPFSIAYFFKKRTLIISIFYLISFGSATINFGSIERFIPKTSLTESQQKVNVIDSKEKAELLQSLRKKNAARLNRNFYITYGDNFFKTYSVVGLSFILLFFFNSKHADDRFNFLMASGLGLYSFSNIVTFSPSLSGRLKTIASVFLLSATIQLLFTVNRFNLNKRKLTLLNKGLTLFLFSCIPFFLFQISFLLQMLSSFIFLFPQLSWVLGDDDVSLREAIGFFI